MATPAVMSIIGIVPCNNYKSGVNRSGTAINKVENRGRERERGCEGGGGDKHTGTDWRRLDVERTSRERERERAREEI